jgi:hypothetical protein
MCCICDSARKSFYPLRDIIDYNQDVLAPFRIGEWSYEINPPNIKDVDMEFGH